MSFVRTKVGIVDDPAPIDVTSSQGTILNRQQSGKPVEFVTVLTNVQGAAAAVYDLDAYVFVGGGWVLLTPALLVAGNKRNASYFLGNYPPGTLPFYTRYRNVSAGTGIVAAVTEGIGDAPLPRAADGSPKVSISAILPGVDLATQTTLAAVLAALGPGTPVDAVGLVSSLIVRNAASQLLSCGGYLDSTAGTATYFVQIIDSAAPVDGGGPIVNLCAPIKIAHTTGAGNDDYWTFASQIPLFGLRATAGIVVQLSSTRDVGTLAGLFLKPSGSWR